MLDQICSPCTQNSCVIQNKSHGSQFLAMPSLSEYTHFNIDMQQFKILTFSHHLIYTLAKTKQDNFNEYSPLERNHGSHAAGACLGQSNSPFLQNQAENSSRLLAQTLLSFLGITPLMLVICGPLEDFSFSVILL